MSLEINLTGVEKTSNKKTSLSDNSDTFYPTQKAVKTAVDAKFNTPTGTTSQYLRGDGSLATFPTIPSITGLVPYTGATGDVDLGNNDLNADGIKIKGTAGNGHLNLKHQSSASTAGGSESVLYADNSGLPNWKNDGNAVEQLAYQSAVNAKQDALTENNFGTFTNGLTSKTTPIDADSVNIVDSADSNKAKRLTFANLKAFLKTYFDTIYTTTSAVATQISTALSNYVPTTRTINGYDLSANRTLTASDVGAVDNSSSAILTALGWWQYNRISESTAVTGTTSETIIENITIPANTYANGGILRFYNNKFRKVGNNGTMSIRVYINSTSNNLSGATLIASFTGIIASQNYAEILRTFTCTTSAVVGFNASQSSGVDTGNSSATRASNAVDWTVAQYLIITVQLSNASDSVTLIGASAKNF